MELHFTGRGAMLYPKEGNTAAYFEDDNNFYLIDCGEDVAGKLVEQGKLNQDKNYYLLVTHTHSDHIGSLGTLQQYLYWVNHKKLNIVVSEEMAYQKELKDIIRGFGLVEDTYNIVDIKELDNKSPLFLDMHYVPSNHGDTPLKSCSIVINTREGSVLYTGDIADADVIEKFIKDSDKIDKMYVDTSYTKSPVHLSIHELKEVIPSNLADKVYCMHINNEKLVDIILEYGYNLVDITKI